MSEAMRHEPGDDAAWQAVRACLSAVVEDGNDAERCLAIQALGGLGDTSAADLLIACLRDDDPDVRCDAGEALGRLGDQRAVEPLIANLRDDPASDAKVVYLRALKALGAREAAPLARILIAGRGEADEIFWEDDYAFWDDWLDVQRVAVEMLAAVGDDDTRASVDAISAALTDPEAQDLWLEATGALAVLGTDGIQALQDLLAVASPLNRKRVAAALGQVDGTQSAALLETLGKDPEVPVRLAAVEAGAVRGLDTVKDMALADAAPEVRALCLRAFDIRDGKVLSRALRDVSVGVKIAACDVIEASGAPAPGLGITQLIERGLRTAGEDALAAMVGAAAVAEPAPASELIEEVANHPATAAKVRLAALRALADLKTAGAVRLLAEAAGDERRDIRLAAIVALGKLATGNSAMAGDAAQVLASAISGDLIEAPADWTPEDDNVVAFTPKKGALGAPKDGKSKIRIDRDGNIVTEPGDPGGDARSDTDPADDEPVAGSTLGRILSANPRLPDESDSVELGGDDLDFLEMAQSRPGRRRLDPESSTPAHLDVRRLAARVAGDTGHARLLPALQSAAEAADLELAQSAVEAIGRLAEASVTIDGCEQLLCRLSAGNNSRLKHPAIVALGHVKSEQALVALRQAGKDRDEQVCAAAIQAIFRHKDKTLDLAQLSRDGSRPVRRVAAEIMADLPSEEAVPLLVDAAHVEDGVHAQHITGLLRRHVQHGLQALAQAIDSGHPHKRLIALQMLPGMVQPD